MLELKPRELVEVTTKTVIAFFFFSTESRLLCSEFFSTISLPKMVNTGIDHVSVEAL